MLLILLGSGLRFGLQSSYLCHLWKQVSYCVKNWLYLCHIGYESKCRESMSPSTCQFIKCCESKCQPAPRWPSKEWRGDKARVRVSGPKMSNDIKIMWTNMNIMWFGTFTLFSYLVHIIFMLFSCFGDREPDPGPASHICVIFLIIFFHMILIFLIYLCHIGYESKCRESMSPSTCQLWK